METDMVRDKSTKKISINDIECGEPFVYNDDLCVKISEGAFNNLPEFYNFDYEIIDVIPNNTEVFEAKIMGEFSTIKYKII